MENYYKILALKVGATLDEVEEKYNKLLKEFDPEKQPDDLKEFFTSERQKVKEAYKEISLSLVDNENIEQVDDEILYDTNEIDSENEYLEEIIESNSGDLKSLYKEGDDDDEDEFYKQAVQIVIESDKASISYLQRRLKIGYNRAARIIEKMEEMHIVTAIQKNGTRNVLKKD
jgi:DNA segregation ATPase FtsK/SpoIIIE-like protein